MPVLLRYFELTVIKLSDFSTLDDPSVNLGEDCVWLQYTTVVYLSTLSGTDNRKCAHVFK